MNLLQSLHRAEQTANELFAKRLKRTDMTFRQAIVLRAIRDNPGVSQTALVEVTRIDRATLADMVRRLHKRGWAHRRRTKEDARAYAVLITPEGAKMLATAQTAAKEAERELVAAMPAVKHLANGKHS